MTGTTDMSLNQGDINELRNWVGKAGATKCGLQKWVVNVGPGTGTFSLNNQFKVTGFGTVAGTNKAPTLLTSRSTTTCIRLNGRLRPPTR